MYSKNHFLILFFLCWMWQHFPWKLKKLSRFHMIKLINYYLAWNNISNLLTRISHWTSQSSVSLFCFFKQKKKKLTSNKRLKNVQQTFLISRKIHRSREFTSNCFSNNDIVINSHKFQVSKFLIIVTVIFVENRNRDSRRIRFCRKGTLRKMADKFLLS